VNQWVRGQTDRELDAAQVLVEFERWPTWMWANREVADFPDWLRAHNDRLEPAARVGFYGLDVYSLWGSLREVIRWVEVEAPESMDAAMRAWQCFIPCREDPHRYAFRTRLVPRTCEADVVALLVALRQGALRHGGDSAAFDAVQNAEVVAGAAEYYRAMVRGDRSSWNVRDRHMADTVDRLSRHLGPASQGLIWEHNTHVGDARATDMASEGMVNLFGEDRSSPWLSGWAGHRAIGVVYEPSREGGNYVPTRMGRRCDALLWFEDTRAITPLRHEPRPVEPEYETEPSGY
jgi:erythromycin esterase-like protein